MPRRSRAKLPSPFRCFNFPPEVIRLVLLLYVRFPLSLRNVEDLLAERGIDLCHETARFWWNRLAPLFAAESHLPFRRRERAMLRFRQMKSQQKFAIVHANVYNHFASERHLVDRRTYKQRRSAALAEWQCLPS